MDNQKYVLKDIDSGKLLSYLFDPDTGNSRILWVEAKETARVFDSLPELFEFEDSLEVELEEVLTMPVYYSTLISIYDFQKSETSTSDGTSSSTST